MPSLKQGVVALTFVIGLLCSVLPAQAGLNPQQYQLKNGMRVLVQRDTRFPLASVRLFVRAGAAWERPEEAGVSHMLEHMVFKGSKTQPNGVDQAVESAGGYLNAYTSYDETVYLTDMPSAEWKVGLEAVRDLAFDPLLRQEDLDAEREVVLAEMKQRADSPFQGVVESLFAQALRDTPYQLPVIGTEATLRAATPESMRDYIQRHYDPKNMLLVVVGDVEPDAVLAEADKLFGSYVNINNDVLPKSVSAEDLQRGFNVQVEKGPWNKVYFGLSLPVPALSDDRGAAAAALGALLGGDDTSLLARELRFNKALVDEISVYSQVFERAGTLNFYALLDAKNLPAFWDALLGILSTVSADSFTDAELERLKLQMIDEHFRARETVGSMAQQLGGNAWSSPGDVNGENALLLLNQVDKKFLQEAIDAWFKPEAFSVAVRMPADTPDLDLEARQQALWPIKGAVEHDESDTLNQELEVIDLGQGRTLILLADDTLPYTSVTMVMHGGGLLQDSKKPEEQGLGSLTAKLLTEGTEGRKAEELRTYLAERSASLSASSAYFDFTLNMECPTRFNDDMFALMREVLTKPSFTQDDLARMKRDQVTEIVTTEESSGGLISRQLRPFLFPNSVYGQYLQGHVDTVPNLTRQQVQAFWKQQAAQPWVLAIAGDFDRAKAMEFAESLPTPWAEAERGDIPQWNAEKVLDLKLPGRNQAMYLMLFPTVPLGHEDNAGLVLLRNTLDGFSGMLMQELREKQSLGYSVWPTNWNAQGVGYLAFAIVAAPEQLEKAEASFKEIAQRLQNEPLDKAVVDRAKASLNMKYYTGRQKVSDRGSEAARNVRYGREPEFFAAELKRIEKLTPEDLQALAKKYLNIENAYSITVQP